MEAVTAPDAFSAREVCELAGCSYRQLDYWARRRLLTPSIRDAQGSGMPARLYSGPDVTAARLIVMLASAAGTMTGTAMPDKAWRMAAVVAARADLPADRFLVDDGESARIVGGRELARLAVKSAYVLTVVKLSDLVPEAL